MYFIDQNYGWIGAEQGKILHTTDGGLTWGLQETSATNRPITGIHFINAKEGWAIGPQRRDGGYILHTISGGEYWQVLGRTNQAGIGVYFLDKDSGWIVLANGTSLITANGGQTWNIRTNNFTGHLQQIKFSGHDWAWATSRDQGVLITRD